MATSTTRQIFHNHQTTSKSSHEAINRQSQELQAAIAKAVELRALHASLMSSTDSNSGFPSPFPVSHSVSVSAHDYPVFTPSYEDDNVVAKSRTVSSHWDEFGVEDQKSVTGSSVNHIAVLRASPRTELLYKSSTGSSVADYNRPASSSNRCKLSKTSSNEATSVSRNMKSPTLVVPMTDSHTPTIKPEAKHRGVISWLFPKLNKKNKNVSALNQAESVQVSQIFKNDFGILSIEALKRQLIAANKSRDEALHEVSEMKSSLDELMHKLEYLESHCEELKKALNLVTTPKQVMDSIKIETLSTRRGIPVDGNGETEFLVSEEVMVEGFLQIVSEARLSVKQFCKTLIGQIEETDSTLVDNLNSLLQRYKVSIHSKCSKAVQCHFEAIVNQSLHQDFENSMFQTNGPTNQLDPQKDRKEKFSSFVSLRNLSWNEVLRKGTKYYSEEFSKFCDRKMSCIITTLNWTRPWSEQLLQAFFVAAKCIWLLHLLAFSFNPPLQILRVEENRSFDSQYMEDIFMDRKRPNVPSRVKVMVKPGFYVKDRVLRCKVICRYNKSAA